MDNNIIDTAAPDGDVLLNDHSLIFDSDIQIDLVEEGDRSWHLRSTPLSSCDSYPG